MFGCNCQPVQKRRVEWCWAAQLCPDAAAAAVGITLRLANVEAWWALGAAAALQKESTLISIVSLRCGSDAVVALGAQHPSSIPPRLWRYMYGQLVAKWAQHRRWHQRLAPWACRRRRLVRPMRSHAWKFLSPREEGAAPALQARAPGRMAKDGSATEPVSYALGTGNFKQLPLRSLNFKLSMLGER